MALKKNLAFFAFYVFFAVEVSGCQVSGVRCRVSGKTENRKQKTENRKQNRDGLRLRQGKTRVIFAFYVFFVVEVSGVGYQVSGVGYRVSVKTENRSMTSAKYPLWARELRRSDPFVAMRAKRKQ